MSSSIAGNTTTTANLTIGTTASGSLDFLGDTDWWRVSLTAGFSYQIWVEGASTGLGTLADPYLAIYNSSGVFQHANNDYSIFTLDSYFSTTPNGSDTFYISVEEFGNNAIGSYRVTAWLDQIASTATAATISPNTQITDRIGWQGDISDWYGITLTAGVNYQFDLISSVRDGLSLALLDGWLALRGSDGALLVSDDNSGIGTNARVFFTPSVTGKYFLDVQESGSNAYGVYTLIVNQAPVSGSLALGASVNGNVDFLGDTDLHSISLTAGITYGFSIDGGTLADLYLEFLDQSGRVLAVDDDSGPGLNSRLTYTPASSGTYYLAARAAGNAGLGTYTATAWILPKVSIADTTVFEGNTGTRSLDFVVSLSAPSPVDVTLTAGTRGSTASAASGDYQGVFATTLVIPAGATSVNFSIPVNGDQVFEPNEGLRAVLSDPVMAVMEDGEARGWIIDDDAPYALPTDWLLRYQWHLYPETGANVFPVWTSWRGAGVKVGVFDQGIDPNHSDLDGNLLTSLGRNAATLLLGGSPVLASDNHGTAVAGVIAAEIDGNLTVGIAPGANLVSIYSSLSSSPTEFAAEIVNAYTYARDIDILNDSWGFGNYSVFGSTYPWAFLDNFRTSTFAQAGQALKSLAELGRGGFGTIVIQSAGNSFSLGDDTNLHNFQNSRYIITVAATDYFGNSAYYSSRGASILISAPGGETSFEDRLGGLLTTDRSGADGYSSLDATSTQGTSFSAPVVSGVVALMLEANPSLGYRDVQQILAYTARLTAKSGNDWRYNGGVNWNGGGLHYDAFDHDFGFGLVDALAAVRLAETWTIGPLTSSNDLEVSATRSLPQTIPDGTSSLQQSVTISNNIEVERVEVTINITHPFVGDLSVLLTSPAGTTSVILWRAGQSSLSAFGQDQPNIDFTFNSVLSMGESGAGTWTLSVLDMAGGYVGQLNSWTLNLIGKPDSADDVYFYTNEFAESVADQAGRATLTDASGTDTLNAAAVTGAMTIDLAPGGVSTIDGRPLTIAAGTTIENAIGGDGADVIRGNAADNVLRGMRGNDSLDGGAGNDRLIGGAGNDTFDWDPAMRGGADTMEGGAGDDTYVVAASDQVIELANEGVDTIWTDVNASLLDWPEVENLFLYGPSAVSASGNAKPNRLNGNDLSNTLGGLGGNDTLEGGAGNDSLDGGDGDDQLIGGAGDDTFDWDPVQRSGADTMEGGTGDDTYVVSTGDVVIELADGGTDTIWSAASRSLQDLTEVENLFLFGSDPVSASGNAKANRLRGNDQANVLSGLGGDDTLEGLAGNDSLDGGAGIDTAVFSGPRKNYTVVWSASAGAFTVTSAAEGTDTVTGIETLSFSDASYSASTLQNNTAPTLTSVSTLTGATEDSAYTITWAALVLAANEADPQGDTIAFRVQSVTSGTLTKNGVAVAPGSTAVAEGESLVWTPAANANGTLPAFQVRAIDAVLESASDVQVSVTVAAVNDAPVLAATLPDRSVNLGTSLNFSFGAATFTDVETANLTYTATRADGSALPAWLTFSADTRTISGTPALGDLGTLSVKVTASDGSLSASDVFDVVVSQRPNTAPVAANATSSTNEDTALTASLPSATDGESDPVTYVKATNPSNGTASVTSGGSYTYTPTANYSGPDSFTYTVSDGQGGSNTYTVSLTVNAVNDAPVATAGSSSATEDTQVTGTLTATDVDNASLSYAVVSQSANGSVVLGSSGSYTYTPAANFNGSDSFTFKANDGSADSNTATVTITVSAVNDAPVVATPLADRSVTLGSSLNFSFGASAFTDVETANLTYAATRADGTALPAWLSFNAGTRTFSGTPASGDLGTVSVKVTASDGSLSASDTFDMVVSQRPNTAPVAANAAGSTNEDTALTASLPAATDGESDPVTYANATNPSNGAVTVTTGGSYTYIPKANFNGTDSFNYTVSDGQGGSSTYTVNLTVNPVNDAPSGAVTINGTATQGQTLTAANNLADVDGIPATGSGSITYQWKADGSPITGATGSTFTLSPAQVGKAITVTASYTDNFGQAESVTSSATGPVITAPATSSLQGITYHWKSHMLLSGVQVTATSASAVQANTSDLLDLRAASWNAATNTLSLEVWSNSTAGANNFGFTVNAAQLASATFTSTLSSQWTVLGNSPASGEFLVQGFNGDTASTGLITATRLGTLQLQLAAGTTSAQVQVSEVSLGSTAVPGQAVGLHLRTTGTNGAYSIDSLAPGSYQLQASRAATDSASAVTSADALAALRIAVGLNPNPDPDGTGPKTAPAISPYQIMAADVNASGSVTSADALAILRMAVKLSTALPQEWLFVEEKRDFWDEGTQKFTLSRTNATWDRNIVLDPTNGVVNLVAVLKGDVNGSWVAPAGSIDLDNLDATYFQRLAQLIGVPTQDLWGGGP